jgi:manganese/zinc/iron transport system permease protein
MMVAPAATASLLSRRLGVILWLSLALAGLAAVLGHLGAITVFPATLAKFGLGETGATSTAGMMAVTAGGLFAMAFVWKMIRNKRPAISIRPEY